jgi:hypothetical protein
MAGTIVTDRIESDASYASSVNIASPLVIANTISLGSAAAITGNVNIDNGTLFVNQNNNRVGIGGITNPANFLDVNTSITITESGVASSNTSLELYSKFSDSQRGYVILKAESNSSGSSDLVVRSRNSFSEAEKFRIDSVGRITAPIQPAFRAFTGTSFTGSTVVIFNSTQFNTGGHYSTDTGRFTAPIAGRYFFTFYLLSASGYTGNFWGGLRQNGTSLAFAEIDWNGNYRTIAASTVVQLAAGDYVDVLIAQGSTYAGGGSVGEWNAFSGYLLG